MPDHAGILFSPSFDWKIAGATKSQKTGLSAQTGFLTKYRRVHRCDYCFVNPYLRHETWIFESLFSDSSFKFSRVTLGAGSVIFLGLLRVHLPKSVSLWFSASRVRKLWRLDKIIQRRLLQVSVRSSRMMHRWMLWKSVLCRSLNLLVAMVSYNPVLNMQGLTKVLLRLRYVLRLIYRLELCLIHRVHSVCLLLNHFFSVWRRMRLNASASHASALLIIASIQVVTPKG